MKTFIVIILIALLVLATGMIYLVKRSEPQIHHQLGYVKWLTYQNNEYGFTIKYPFTYSPTALAEPILTNLGRRRFLDIVDPMDISFYVLHVIPARVAIIKQPMSYRGQVYRSLEDYTKAGFAQGSSGIVSVNGFNALHFHHHASSMQEDAPYEQYMFIRNDLIYQLDLKTDDPFRDEILHSFRLIETSSSKNPCPPAPEGERPRDFPFLGGESPR